MIAMEIIIFSLVACFYLEILKYFMYTTEHSFPFLNQEKKSFTISQKSYRETLSLYIGQKGSLEG